jgi:hypothetical protein
MFILLALPKQQLKDLNDPTLKLEEKKLKNQFTFPELITHILSRIEPFLLLFA